MTRSRLLLAAALTLCGTAAAQGPLPDTLVWERAGTGWPHENQADGLYFDGDTLYAAASQGVWRLDPGRPWRTAFGERASDGTDMGGHSSISVSGPVVLLATRGLLRSSDGGATFREVLDRPEAFPVRLPSGRLIVADEDPRGVIATSDDGGERWGRRPYLPPYWLGSFAAVVPGGPGADPSLPAHGRVVGFGISGMATSDDEGETWSPTNVTCQLCLRVAAVVTLDGGPEAGRAVASVDDNRAGGVSGGLWHSADGAAWTRVGRTFDDIVDVELLATPGGGLVAYSDADDRLRGSDDGGRTWRPLGEVDPTGDYRVRGLAVGPDGRLYAALRHAFASPPTYGGVWRTADPVYAVSDEPTPGRPAGLGLSVAPNPTAGRATVEVSGLGPGAVQVTVHDALGREVAVMGDGPVRDGQRLAVETAGWAPGVYVVRAVDASGATASARLTVVR